MAPRRSNPTDLDSFVIDCSGEQLQAKTWTSPSDAQSGETLSGVRESPATTPFVPSRVGKLWPVGCNTSFCPGLAAQPRRISYALLPILDGRQLPAPAKGNGYTTLLPQSGS